MAVPPGFPRVPPAAGRKRGEAVKKSLGRLDDSGLPRTGPHRLGCAAPRAVSRNDAIAGRDGDHGDRRGGSRLLDGAAYLHARQLRPMPASTRSASPIRSKAPGIIRASSRITTRPASPPGTARRSTDSNANGEIFDANALTAAHRTLPMPVNVRVTNLENGKSLIVRVNDRGPFARGRIIDVSEQAAKLLGFYGKGTARVRVTYMSRAELPATDTPAGPETPPAIANALPAAPADAGAGARWAQSQACPSHRRPARLHAQPAATATRDERRRPSTRRPCDAMCRFRP